MLYGKGEGPPPFVLQIKWMCETYGVPPAAGPILEQDYGMIYRMNALDNVANAVRRFYTLKGNAIHSLTDSERMTLRWLKEEGLIWQPM